MNNGSRLAELCMECRQAPVVYLYILEQGVIQGSTSIGTSRKQIAKGVGIRSLRTISKALKALRQLEYINYKSAPKLRLELPSWVASSGESEGGCNDKR